MSRKRVISVRCPTCRKLVLQEEPDFPFCSERCRLIDLGKWATPLNEADQYGEAGYASNQLGGRGPTQVRQHVEGGRSAAARQTQNPEQPADSDSAEDDVRSRRRKTPGGRAQ